MSRTLEARLEQLRTASAGKIPAEQRAIMGNATQALRDSGILDGIPKVGSRLPAFELPDTDGQVVRSEDLLAKGPLVVTIYRGVW